MIGPALDSMAGTLQDEIHVQIAKASNSATSNAIPRDIISSTWFYSKCYIVSELGLNC